MPWARIDDTFYDHPKILDTPLAAIGLHVKALSWCNRYLTDGLVSASAVKRLGGSRKMADELVEHGLWERTGTGYTIHDFLTYSRSKVQVESDREASRVRQEEWRRSHGSSNGVTTSAPSRTRPVPIPRSSSREVERAGDVLKRIAGGS